MARPRILLVDDDRRIRKLVGLTLHADDYELDFAENGAEAMQLTRELKPALIILDYAMPDMDGVEVCATLRSDSTLDQLVIVMLSGHTDADLQDRAVAAGVNGYLTKPFSPLTLEHTIRSLLDGNPAPLATVGGTSRSMDIGGVATVPNRISPSSIISLDVRNTLSMPGEHTHFSARHPKAERPVAPSRRKFADLHETFLSTIEALATALELRSAETEGHSQRVSLYAMAAARQMRLSEDDLDQIRWGSILHDIGLIAVPDAILLKPGHLLPEEWALVRLHPEHGAKLLQHVPGLDTAKSIIRFHHERFDGAGYPLGLRGTAIPLAARIFAVADTLDAITTDRPYRPTRTWEEARVEILQGRGSHFDPNVVDTFLEIFGDLQGLTGPEKPLPPFV